MRICVTIRSLANGGAEKQSVLLSRALVAEHELRFVATAPEPCEAKHLRALKELGIEVHFLRQRSFPAKLRALARYFREEAPELVISHLPGDTFLAALAGYRAGVPAVYGGLRNSALSAWKWPVLRWLHEHRLAGIVANSGAARDAAAERGFDPQRVSVIPNGIDVPEAPPKREAHAPLRVLCVGRFVAQKDFETALRAFAKATREADAQAELWIAGNGPDQSKLEKRIEALGLAATTRLITGSGTLGPLYEEADIYLSTSRFEGLSNAALEAMAAALPLVLTDVGDQAALVGPECNGMLVAAGDVDGIASALRRLLDDPARRLAFGEDSYRRVCEGFSFPRFQERVLDFVEHAVA